jgi:hypothetical protein
VGRAARIRIQGSGIPEHPTEHEYQVSASLV